MVKLKSRFGLLLVVAFAAAALWSISPGGWSTPGQSKQGKVVRAEVTLDAGAFAVQLTTRSNVEGEKNWVPEGRTYTGTYHQDVLVMEGERMHFYLTAATDIDRKTEKRTLRCQLYENGRPLPGDGKDSRPIRKGEAGEAVSCTALVVN